MSVISDLLGIPHFSTSNGSTVRRDFLEAVAVALGLDPQASATKDDLLLRCIAAAQRSPINEEYGSPGGTVTDAALQAMVDGITEHGDVAPPPLEDQAARDEEDFDPEAVADERTRVLVEVAAREGQDRFRAALMDAYSGRCAMSGADAVGALEAAHIVPYLGPRTNRVTNGLLLRADLHRLFDRGSLSVREETLEILIKPHLRFTTYRDLEGRRITVPRASEHRPSNAALRHQRLWAGL